MRRFILYLSIILLSAMNIALADQSERHTASDKKHTVCKDTKKEHTHEKAESAWHGSKVQAGLALTTGNTKTLNINSAIDLNYTHKRWNNLAQASAQFGKDDGIVNKEKYIVQDQLSYSLNNIKAIDNYLFVNAFVNFDHFSPFDYQSVYTAGYGRDWVKNEHFVFSTQVGPGVRHDKQRNTGKIRTNFVISLKSYIAWNISSSLSLSEKIRYDMGDPFGSYNYLQAVTAITNQIIHNLSIELSFTIDNYSKIPLGSSHTKKTDTTTNVALVYNFNG